MTNILREIKEIILENAFIIILIVGPALFAMSFDAEPSTNNLEAEKLAKHSLSCLKIDADKVTSEQFVNCLTTLSKLKANQ